MNIKEKIDKYINDRGLLKTPAHYVKELFNDIINKVYDVELKPENIILFDTNKLNIDTKNGYYYNENLLSSIKITMAGDIIQPKVEFNGLSPKIELPKNIIVNNKLINYNGIGKYVLSFNNNTCDIERYKCDFTKAPSGYIVTTYYPEYLGDYPLSNNNYMFISLDRDYTTAYGPVMENEKFITYVGTSIEPYLFESCALNSVKIPNSVKTIGEGAFAASLLNSIEIPDSVTNIGIYAFAGCYNLTSVVWNPINYPDFEWGDWYGDWECDNPFYYSCDEITSFKFGDGVEHIPAYMCTGMSNLKSITIPNSVTSIGSSAFANTPWLENQPDGCVYINNILYVYEGEMPENTHIDVREGTTLICGGGFYDYYNLSSIEIPNSVTSIGDWAFGYCSGLTSITIPDSVTSIGEEAFSGCSGLTSITIPDSVTSIEYYTFGYCSGLTSITIPNSVTSIGIGAFEGTGLTSITIPNSVTEISDFAFNGCEGLTSVTLNSTTPPTIGDSYVFDTEHAPDLQIYVPDESVDAYKTAPNWSSYASIIKPISEKSV